MHEEYVIGFYKPLKTIAVKNNEDQQEMLHTLIDGKRLRDISDLPFDLAV
ncbi:NgoMIV family type II restriction endonuclease [Roseiflexus sp.]|nr:NgoMIV family type II restriction endonuclease [Roseiflexus sp.]